MSSNTADNKAKADNTGTENNYAKGTDAVTGSDTGTVSHTGTRTGHGDAAVHSSDTGITRKTVLITGASFGIGYELSRVFAENGYDQVLVARDKARLEAVASELRETYGVKVTVIVRDLSKPDAAQELHEALQKQKTGIDVLVNNAGFGINGFFTGTDTGRQKALLQLNITTLTLMCRLFGADMVQRGSGHILNVASTASFQPGPWMSTYYASKAYVLMFTEALHTELKKHGVVAGTLCPGPTKTEFQERAGMKTAVLAQNLVMMRAADVAKAGYRGLMKGKRVIIPGFMNKAGALLQRFFPRSMVCAIVARMNRERGG